MSIPTPTQIDCVHVDKVFDSCFQTLTANTQMLVGPEGCTGPLDCSLSEVSCAIVSTAPTGEDDLQTVSFLLSATLTMRCQNQVESTRQVHTMGTAVLFLPLGAVPSCDVASASCICVPLS